VESIAEVAELIAEHNITNEIQGANEDGNIILMVEYEKEDRKIIYELMDIAEVDEDNEEED